MGDVWFTSDTHFCHRRVAELRGFATVEEHDETLIGLWNAKVKPGAQVWHLGDVGGGPSGAERTASVLDRVRRLNGVIHLIAGNHDPVHPMHRDSHKHIVDWMQVFETVQAFARRRVEGGEVLLSHLPFSGDHTPIDRHTQYRLRDEGLPLLHGHVHDLWKVRGNQVNVGVDVWGFAPVHLDEVAPLLK